MLSRKPEGMRLTINLNARGKNEEFSIALDSATLTNQEAGVAGSGAFKTRF